MLSQATSVDGQGVGSAYIEQVALVKECDDLFETEINSKSSKFDIYHINTSFHKIYEYYITNLWKIQSFIESLINLLWTFIKSLCCRIC